MYYSRSFSSILTKMNVLKGARRKAKVGPESVQNKRLHIVLVTVKAFITYLRGGVL